MRFGAIASRAALILALQVASSLTLAGPSAGQQPVSSSPAREETAHVRLSTPVVKAWREIPAGSPAYALDDAVRTRDWLDRALIQLIDFQTGLWYVWVERGYTVFRICPYLSKGSPRPSVYQGIVLKVNGTLSVKDLIAAIRNRTPTIVIDEYWVFGADGVDARRYSRPHDKVGMHGPYALTK